MSSERYVEYGFDTDEGLPVVVRIAKDQEDSYVEIGYGENCVLGVEDALSLMNIIQNKVEGRVWQE